MIVDEHMVNINSQLLVDMCTQSLKNLKAPNVISLQRNMPHQMFREEFGTVRIMMPRRSGHTTAALQLIVEYPDSLLFVRQTSHKDSLRHLIREYTSNVAVRRRVDESVIALSDSALKDIRPIDTRPFVIFDQRSLFRNNQVAECIAAFQSAQIVVELQ